MENFVYFILASIIPAILVFAAAYIFFKKINENESRKIMAEMRNKNSEKILPLRLQSYERLALFLERINPNNLVMRIYKPGMSSRLLQSELLKNIRAEYEHNLAQQIYVSPMLWHTIKVAKEETIKLINISTSKVNDEASGADLSKSIFEVMHQLENNPSDFALDVLKKEIKKLF
jgi:hypothetical protein